MKVSKCWSLLSSQLHIYFSKCRKHCISSRHIYWMMFLVCQGGSGSRPLPPLLSECVALQICITAVDSLSLSHGLQFYDIYHRRFSLHTFQPYSGVPQGSVLGSKELWWKCISFFRRNWLFTHCNLNAPVMRFGSYCCDTDKRHRRDFTSENSGKDFHKRLSPLSLPSTPRELWDCCHTIIIHQRRMKSPISLSHALWIKSIKCHICRWSQGAWTNQPLTETQIEHCCEFCDKSWWFYLALSTTLSWSV